MKFFLDENFPKAAAPFLEAQGHECFDPRGTELEGSDDDVLLAEARTVGAVFLTTDRDFSTHYNTSSQITQALLSLPSRRSPTARRSSTD